MNPGADELRVYDALDVAEAVLRRAGRDLNPIVLQKILYYIKAWSLGWGSGPVFRQAIQAWANGPVVPAVYNMHRQQRRVAPGQINPAAAPLDARTQQIVDSVFDFYKDYAPEQLIALTHHDAPWRLARARDGAGPGERSQERITRQDMQDYYSRRMRDSSSSSRMPAQPAFVRRMNRA